MNDDIREKNKNAQRKWREKNKEKNLENQRRYYLNNKDAIKERRKNNPQKEKERSKKRNLSKYGIDVMKFNEMYEAQDGKCAICKEKKKLVVDHNHKNGEVRMLLCSKCNVVLGMANEDVSILEKAILYIRSFIHE